MNKKKKIYILSILLFIVLVITSFIGFSNRTYSAGTTQYKDWSEVNDGKIQEDFSYSTLFRSEETQIKVIKEAGKAVEDTSLFFRDNITPGSELIVLVTKCATNKNGELLDVVVKINNVKKFSAASSGNVKIRIGSRYRIAESQKDPSSYETRESKVNEPLVFAFDTTTARANFTMTYYKTGTYDSETDSGTLGNINSVSGIYWDFDIYTSDTTYKNELFGGEEGVVPLTPDNGTSTIYYNKSKKHGSYPHTLKEQNNGIAIDTRTGSNTNTIYYESSAFITTDKIENSTYSFTYSGKGCGILYMFASPYPFEIDSPTKSADKTEIKPGDTFTYTVSQYVPNNYYGTLFSYNEIYSNLYKSTRFNSIVIKDTIDSHLTFDKNQIRVFNENNVDVTNYFKIEKDENTNTVTATVNKEKFEEVGFYAHTYKLKIPVTVNSDTANLEKIANKATTTSSICRDDSDCPSEEKETNTVDVKMKYNLTVNYIEGSSKNVIAPKDVSDAIYYYNNPYKTNYNKVDLKMWRIDKSEVAKGEGNKINEDSKIIEGNIKGNTVVNYYFERREYPVIVNYYDAETKEKIAESDKTIYYYTMNYYTNYDKIDSDVWEYVSQDGDGIEGEIDGNQESYTINYYFNRLKYRLLVNYYDDKTKAKISKGDRYIYNYQDKYTTNYEKIDPKYWEYVRTEGETPGVIYEDTGVDYYFKTSQFRILVNYYDKETGEKIDDPDVLSKKYGEEYTTNDDKIDKKKWELVEVPKNAKGIVDGDTEVNYYYKKREYKLIVNYYEEGTKNKIADSNENIFYYQDKYITDYSKIDSNVWKLVEMPENYQGEILEDTEVNYYFRRIGGGSGSYTPGKNPQTGPSQNIIIIEIVTMIAIILVVIITTYKIYLKRKIYKL